jgi:hypothetical protein
MQRGCFAFPLWSSDSIAQDGQYAGDVFIPTQFPFINSSCFSVFMIKLTEKTILKNRFGLMMNSKDE